MHRQMIEGRIAARTEEISESTQKHAKELHRRDQVEEELHRISVTDVMTGMLNRRGFFLNAERSFKVARRQEIPSALIYADLDELKTVNDELGHDAGDRLIQDAGRILQASFRGSDVVARFGRDECGLHARRGAAGSDSGPDTVEHRKLSPALIATLPDFALHRDRAV